VVGYMKGRKHQYIRMLLSGGGPQLLILYLIPLTLSLEEVFQEFKKKNWNMIF